MILVCVVPPRSPGAGGAVPAGTTGVTVWLTATPLSTTVPQLVTVIDPWTVRVGGSTTGVGPGTADEGSLQLSPTMPGPPDVATAGGAGGTADGTRPAAVMTSSWNGIH